MLRQDYRDFLAPLRYRVRGVHSFCVSDFFRFLGAAEGKAVDFPIAKHDTNRTKFRIFRRRTLLFRRSPFFVLPDLGSHGECAKKPSPKHLSTNNTRRGGNTSCNVVKIYIISVLFWQWMCLSFSNHLLSYQVCRDVGFGEWGRVVVFFLFIAMFSMRSCVPLSLFAAFTLWFECKGIT